MNEIAELNETGLRKFGFTTSTIVTGLFGLLVPWLRDRPFPVWPWVIASVLAGIAIVAPTGLRSVYRYWMKFGLMLAWVNTRIILGVVFWIMILPLGIVLRLVKEHKVGRLTETWDNSVRTYWRPRSASHNTNLEKPF